MADYSQLISLERKPPQPAVDSLVSIQARKAASLQTDLSAKPLDDKAANLQVDKAAKPIASKPAKPQSRLASTEKPDRYTTRLVPSLVKQIKQYALDHDMDDKDVVTEALNAYLARGG